MTFQKDTISYIFRE